MVLSQNKNTTVFSFCVLLFVWTPGLCLDGHFLTLKTCSLGQEAFQDFFLEDMKAPTFPHSGWLANLTTQVILLTHYIQEKGHLQTLLQFSVANTHLAL